MSSAVSSSRLHVARDPALALVVRIFVGSVADRFDVPETSRDDLRLAASELFAAAIETGEGDEVAFTITREDDVVALDATGIDQLVDDGEPDPGVLGDRLGLIRALFPEAEVGRSVRVSVPLEAPGERR